MCGIGVYFLDDFIIPSLDSKRFPCLSWIDRDEKLYKVKWLHKGSRTWRENDFDIFCEWDRMKGHHNPQIPGYWTLAKQRFRNAHSKLEKIGRVKREKLQESKGFRVYRITSTFDPQQTYCNSPDLLTKDNESNVYVNILPTFQPGQLYFACQDGIFPVKLEPADIVNDTGMIFTEILADSHIENSDGLMKEECLDKNEFGDVDCDLVMPTGYEDVLCDPVMPTGYEDVLCDPVVPTGYEDVLCDPVVPTGYEDVLCDPVVPTGYEDVLCDPVVPTGYEDVLCDPVVPTGYEDVLSDPVVPTRYEDVLCDPVVPTGYEDVLCDPVVPTGYEDVDCDPIMPTGYEDVDCDPVIPIGYEDVHDPVLPTKCEVDLNIQFINPNLMFQSCEPNNVQQNNCKDDVLDTDSENLSFYNFMNDKRENWQLPLNLCFLEDLEDTENMMEMFGDLKTMEMNEK